MLVLKNTRHVIHKNLVAILFCLHEFLILFYELVGIYEILIKKIFLVFVHFALQLQNLVSILKVLPVSSFDFHSIKPSHLQMAESYCGKPGKIQGMMLKTLNGIEIINVSNSNREFFSKWPLEFIGQTKIGCRLLNINNVISIITGIFQTLVNILFYLIYGYAITNKKIEGLTTGSFMAFLSAYSSFQGAFPGVVNSLLK